MQDRATERIREWEKWRKEKKEYRIVRKCADALREEQEKKWERRFGRCFRLRKDEVGEGEGDEAGHSASRRVTKGLEGESEEVSRQNDRLGRLIEK